MLQAMLECDGIKLAVFGGVEHPDAPEKQGTEHDNCAYERLLHADPASLDVLLTHEPPYGISKGFFGQTQGSTQVSALVERLQPCYYLAGHLHHLIGPRQTGRTMFLGLSMPGKTRTLRRPEPLSALEAGTPTLLDTETRALEVISSLN